MLVANFRDEVLIDPIKNGMDYLRIVTGYATPNMASWHIMKIKELDLPKISIELFVGMCSSDGISISSHRGFLDIVDQYSNSSIYSNFSCSYVYRKPGVHSKLYIWYKNNVPSLAFIGSANYSSVAFSSSRREILEYCNPTIADSYFRSLIGDTIYCNALEAESLVTVYKEVPYEEHEKHDEDSRPELASPDNTVSLSLLARDGNIHNRAGLNWGQRPGRNPDQAYIPLPSTISRSGFFPLNEEQFTVLTDDNKALILRVEQQNNKAITTPENNSRIGEYFRNRLGVPSGAFVKKEDLLRYGRTDVIFYKFDDEHYYMDFSKPIVK